jgi:hypothetical protein
MGSVCAAVAPLVGATAPDRGRLSWLLLREYEIEVPGDSSVLTLRPDGNLNTRVSIRFVMGHSPGLWGHLHLDGTAGRPRSRLMRILTRPLFAAGEATTSGDPSFDGLFAARSYQGPRLWTVVTPEFRQVLLTLAGDLAVLERYPDRRGLDLAVHPTEMQLDLRIPASWLPPAEFVAEVYDAARATHQALEQACQS